MGSRSIQGRAWVGLNPVVDAKIIKAFHCFGDKPLDQLDATASPSNPASWKILVNVGFKPATCGLEWPEATIDYDHKEFDSFKAMEDELLTLFEPSSNINSRPLSPGKRYCMIDPEGKIRTVSKHPRWKRMKYHFEHKDFIR